MENPNRYPHGQSDISPAEFAPMGRMSTPHVSPEQGCGCQHLQPEPPTCPMTCKACADSRYGLEGYPLAMVYAPCQAFKDLYDLDTALMQGTLFSQLDLPIQTANGTGGRGCSCGQHLRS